MGNCAHQGPPGTLVYSSLLRISSFLFSLLIFQGVLISSVYPSSFSHRGWATSTGQWGHDPASQEMVLLQGHSVVTCFPNVLVAPQALALWFMSIPSSHVEAVLGSGQE